MSRTRHPDRIISYHRFFSAGNCLQKDYVGLIEVSSMPGPDRSCGEVLGESRGSRLLGFRRSLSFIEVFSSTVWTTRRRRIEVQAGRLGRKRKSG